MDNTAGLSAREVDESRRKFGENKLTKRKRKSIFRQFLENLGDPVIRILLCALAVNILFLFKRADWFETGGIAAAVFMATFISTLSEYGSEAAFEDGKYDITALGRYVYIEAFDRAMNSTVKRAANPYYANITD